MDELWEERYEDYLLDYQAWGQQLVPHRLSRREFESIACDLDHLEIQEECRPLTQNEIAHRESLEKQILTHESYFKDGPRVMIIMSHNDDQ